MQNQLQEGLKLRSVKDSKLRQDPLRMGGNLENARNKLIIERVIGHKKEIPGIGQWKQLVQIPDKCWICDQRVFSIIFWSTKIGFLA